MDLPKVRTHFKAVKSTTTKFNCDEFYHNYVNFYNMHKSICDNKNSSAVMESEKLTLCEINACLWINALYSATNSLTEHTYSHYIIAQKFINYLLNTDSTENFGLIENYFWKLLLTHPPSPEMFDYYSPILLDKFVCFNGKEIENQTILFCLIEAITDCLKIMMDPNGNIDINKSAIKPEILPRKGLHFIDVDMKSQSKETLNIISRFSCHKPNYFNKLPLKEKVERCLMVLNFVYNILESDFIFWLHSKEFKPCTDNNRPLLCGLLWENQRDFGSVNKEIQKLFQLYKLAMNFGFRNVIVIDKLLTLIGEVIRCSDSGEGTKHPFVGANSVNFFRELSLILYHRLVEKKGNLEENELVVNFKPPWLRLFLCSHLLTLITRHQCLPELTEVYDILKYIIRMENKDTNSEKLPLKSSDATNLQIKKRERFKNVNTKLRNGKTHLHSACENNDVGKIKMLLTFPELDVNAIDRDGWTALHLAAHAGKITSVQELLLFTPKPGGIQKSVNTRAKGPKNTTPLMCAASQGYAKICKLLLEHSGSILLEDVNELNQTALEITKASEVRRILKYYKSNSVWTANSFKDINFDPGLKKIVMKLCVELIQAYFSTYNTWNIYRKIKQSEKTAEENITSFEADFKWDCLRYDRDIKININKLKSLLPELESIKEFESLSDIYKTIFSLIKTS